MMRLENSKSNSGKNTTVSSNVRLRQNRIASHFKVSQPETIEMTASKPLRQPGGFEKAKQTEIVIEEETPKDRAREEVIPLKLDGLRNDECEGGELGSKLSFIVKEKLHIFASGIRRRTSEVADEMEKETTSEQFSTARTEEHQAQHRPSLMSLIGLQRLGQEEPKTKRCLPKRLAPSLINPRGYKYLLWLCVLTVAFLYNAIVIPLRSTYPYQTKANLVYWLMGDYVADALYLTDLLLIKPRIIFMRGGIPVKDRKETTKNYISSATFTMDLVCLTPLDFMYFLTGPIAAWRFPRLLKLKTFWEMFDLLDNSFSTAFLIRVAKTLFYIIYIIHCNGCIYYLISAWEGFGQIAYRGHNKWYINKWAYNNQGTAYFRCFYFVSAVATSIGNLPAPTNVIEYIFMTFSWMMGVFVFALLLGQVRDIVSNAGRNREQYRNTMDTVLGECKRLQLSKLTTDRVRDWFNYTWQQQKTLDEQMLIDKLPLKLQTDLALSVHYNTFSKVQLFQDCDRALIRELVLKLRPVIFLPEDWICRKGDVGKEMYIVNEGVLEIIGGENNEKVFAELTEGSVFGEISLLAIGGNNRRTANIRSKGYSTLFVLSKKDLNDVIKDYPEAHKLLKIKAKQMLRNDTKMKEKSEQAKHKSLEEMCRVSTHISTPKMLNTVVKILPKQSITYQHLQQILGEEEQNDAQKEAAELNRKKEQEP